MTLTPLEQSVLNYNLFGEAGDLPDVVHCETIEARSVLHDWELAQHRHGRLHQVLLVEAGGGSAVLEGERHALGAMRAVNVPMGCIHSFTFTPGTEGWVVTLASEILDDTLEHSDELRRVLARPGVFAADRGLRTAMKGIFAEHAGRDFARAQILQSLSGLVARCLLQGGAAAASDSAPDPRFRRFEELLEAHFADHWAVADYANELGMTPVHLSRLTRAATGRTASRLIEERLVREARRNLVYTGLPVSTIAYTLGFNDPAYFSRMFSRVTGLSPRAFRQRMSLS